MARAWRYLALVMLLLLLLRLAAVVAAVALAAAKEGVDIWFGLPQTASGVFL
jgi:hypothetical protein